MRLRVGREDVVSDGDTTRVRVFDHNGRRSLADRVHQAPRRFRVVDVEIAHLLATVLHCRRPPTGFACRRVTSTDLMRVLAVTENLIAHQRELDGLGKIGRRVVCRSGHGCGAGGRHAGIEPGEDLGVVGRGVRECIARQTRPRLQ